MTKKQKFSDHEMARRRDALRGYMSKPHPMVVAYQEILQSWKRQPEQFTKNDFARITNATRAGDYEALKNFLTKNKSKKKRVVN